MFIKFGKTEEVKSIVDSEEIRRQNERIEYEKKEQDKREYDKKENERRLYESAEYDRREKDRREYEEKKFNIELNQKKQLLEQEHFNNVSHIKELDRIENEKRTFTASQSQQVTEINSIVAGNNIQLYSENGKIIISSQNTDKTTIKHGLHTIQGDAIEIESDENIIINTIHPNKIKLSLNIGKLLTRIIELEKKVGV